ncbi:MAG: Lipopolysaccharide heptosyltransferase 1 [Fimbriimonadaceae bacterium]|nr:Lipopolysaccharide heptosyltransferase 1 [Fimbriimonadaceae bacterium]
MTAWAATAIHRAMPGAEIVWAVETRCAPLLDVGRSVSEAYLYDRGRWKGRRWNPATWSEQIRFYAGLRRYGFDWGMDFQGHSKTALCLKLSGAKRRLGVRATDPWARRLNPIFDGIGASPHVVDVNQAAIQSFGSFNLPSHPDLPQGRLPGNFGDVTRLITLSTSAGRPWKSYPIEAWRHVAEVLAADGFRVVSLGGPGDPTLDLPNAEDWVGRTSITETLGAVAASTLHLSADTGTGHMAAATGTPVVSLFSRTDPAVYRPYGEQVTVLRAADMGLISPQDVLEAASRFL